VAFDTGVAPAGGQPQAGVTGRAAGARVYLHTSLRPYVATVMGPLSRALVTAGAATQVHLATGWRFGPHLELRAAGCTPTDWDAVAGALAEGARNFPCPSTADSEARYLRSAVALGRIEAVPPPYLPCRPHGHTETVTLRGGPLERLRGLGGAQLLPPLVDAAAAPSDSAVLSRVAEALLALADTHPHGMRFGTFSLRSHAEAFFHWAGPAAPYRAEFDARMGRDRPVLEAMVHRQRDGATPAAAMAWRQAFQACQADFQGRVTAADLVSGPVADGPSGARGASPFHAAVAASGVIDETPEWFDAYRLTINLFYELLPALDVSPIQRFYLCYAIAQSVDDVFGESWQERLAAVASLMAAGR
jgi:hypothetical protein